MEASVQLNDTKVYQKSNAGPLPKVNSEVEDILGDILHRKDVKKKIMDFFIIKKTQLDRFYLLPKIHTRSSNVPDRP